MVKCLPSVRETWVQSLGWEDPWVGKILWKKNWQPTPVFLPGKHLGWWSLVGYGQWGSKELDVTKQLTLFSKPIVYLDFLSPFSVPGSHPGDHIPLNCHFSSGSSNLWVSCTFFVVDDFDNFFFFFWLSRMACGTLVPWLGIELGPSAVRAWSPKCLTPKEFAT